MEIGAASIAQGAASKIGEDLVDMTVKQGHYLFHFKKIVKDLKEREDDLKSAERHMNEKVETARNNTEIIDEDVKKWQTNTSNILTEVQRLKEEIEEKKSCLNGWCPNWGCRYWLSRKAAKKTNILLKQLNDYDKIEIIGHRAPLSRIDFLAPKDFELFQSSKYAFDKIIEALRNDEINLVGLYGMGGSGKTTLAKKLGAEVKEKGIFDEVLMVVVSQNPNFKDIQSKLARELGMELKEEDEIERANRLYLRFKETKKKTLIILDDVWKKFELESKIGFPFGEDNKLCKVLLTTRRQQLCTAIRCQLEIPLKLLTEDEGLTLLKRQAGIDDDSFTSQLKALAIEVAQECKGLPLPLVTIGSALKGKGMDEWKLVSQKLKKSKLVDVYDIVDLDENVYACLKVSYDYLENEKTKLCFLLCSLFPEDYKISVEELIVYGVGLGLFSDVDLIEDARSELRATLKSLRASCLLLDANEEGVKMHDMVRDVALWIASKEKNVFMSKSGMGLTEWSNVKGWEQYTAVSLWYNEIKELPVELVCPKLEILFLGGTYESFIKFSDECFKETKAFKVLSLKYVDLSLKSLEFLTNLTTLKLIDCIVRDISYLRKLNKLEILFLQIDLDELPRELGALRKLRLLDFINYKGLVRIPSHWMEKCSQLEEFCIRNEFELWEVEEKSEETSRFSLFELNPLSRLVNLHLQIKATCLPKGFAFPKLQRHRILVNIFDYGARSYNRALEISNTEVSSLVIFKALYETLEYLYLKEAIGCQNIVPDLDQGGLNKLKSLQIGNCNDLKCILDTSQQRVQTSALTDLVTLSLDRLMLFREICYGSTLPGGFLEKLETIDVTSCPDICCLFPTNLLLRLHKLKNVKISSCAKLQEVFQFQLKGSCHSRKEDDRGLMSCLTQIKLEDLSQVRHI